MRLDPATLALLHSRATDGFAHAVDVMRLVEEVWALNDTIRTLEKTTVALPDTGEFIVASITHTKIDLLHGGYGANPTITDWQGRRLVPTTDPVDGTNVVVTDRGVIRYDPPVVTPPTTGYPDPTKTYVPQWDWKPGQLTPPGSGVVADLSIPDMLGLLQQPTPLSKSMYEELIAELERRGYKLSGSTPPSVSSNELDGDAPTIVEK